MSDLISRQAAIDAVNNAFDRETLLTGFVRSIAVRAIRDMQSAQPEPSDAVYRLYKRAYEAGQRNAQTEIVRCKDCKHYQFADNRAFGMPVKMCEWFGFEDVDDDDYCSRAERRTDEPDK